MGLFVGLVDGGGSQCARRNFVDPRGNEDEAPHSVVLGILVLQVLIDGRLTVGILRAIRTSAGK